MHLVCPHCHNPIELAKVAPAEELACPSCGSTFRVEGGASTDSVGAGRAFGRFTLLAAVGHGAFGTVYKARDPDLDRAVAVKVPRAGSLAGPHELDRFLREARSAAQLRHPGIVAVHEVGVADGTPYLVADFIDGVPLSDWLTARKPTQREAAELVATVADAVQYAHSRGVVHRDLKPSNIMLDAAGRPVVLDFGLAKRDAGEVTMTVDGQILGTPAYMSPEQARGESHRVDGRSDVYSLGVVLYQLLTSELPFRGTKRMLLHQVLHDEPRPPRRVNDTVARDLETVCLKAMAKEPGRRYATAGDLAADLRRWLAGEPIQARPVGAVERGWRWCRRNAALASALAAVLLVFAAGAAVSATFAVSASAARGQAEADAEQAKTDRAAAELARNDLAESNDRLLTNVARGLLRPLGSQDVAGRPVAFGLIDPEIDALWELAEARDGTLRLRFVEEGLKTSTTTRQLGLRALFTMHAAVGLDPERRDAVERMLASRLRGRAGDDPAEERMYLAMCLTWLGGIDAGTAREAGAALVAGLSVPRSDVMGYEEIWLSPGMAEVTTRMEPREAVEFLIPFIGKARGRTDALRQRLGQSVSRMAADEAAEVLTRYLDTTKVARDGAVIARLFDATATRMAPDAGLELLLRALSTATDPGARKPLAEGLAAVVVRHEPRAAAARLRQGISATTDDFVQATLAEALAEVAARMEPAEAAEACAEAAGALAQTMTRRASAAGVTSPNAVSSYPALARGLVALTARMEPKAGAATCAKVAAAVAELLPKARFPTHPADALRTAVAGMEPTAAADLLVDALKSTTGLEATWFLAEGFAAVAARMAPEDAKVAGARAAPILIRTLTTRPDRDTIFQLGKGLVALSPVLGPDERKATATAFVEALGKSKDLYALRHLVGYLDKVAAGLEPAEASAVCGQAVAILAGVVVQGRVDQDYFELAQGLGTLALRLERTEANEAAARLVQDLANPTYAASRARLAYGLTAVASRMEPGEAAAIRKHAAAILDNVMARTTDVVGAGQLLRAVGTVAAGMEPTEAVVALARAMNKTQDSYALRSAGQGLAAAAARLEPRQAVAVLDGILAETTNPLASRQMTEALIAAVERLEPTEAAAAHRDHIHRLQAVLFDLDPKDDPKDHLAALPRVTRRWATQVELILYAAGLALTADRLEPGPATAARARAAPILATAASKGLDAAAARYLAGGLAAVARRLEPPAVQETVTSLAQAITRAEDYETAKQLFHALRLLVAGLEPAEAAARRAQVATTFAQAGLGQPSQARPVQNALQALAGLCASPEPVHLTEATAILTKALSKRTDPYSLPDLVQGVAAVVGRLPAEQAGPSGSQAATAVLRALPKILINRNDGGESIPRQSLLADLRAVLTRDSADRNALEPRPSNVHQWAVEAIGPHRRVRGVVAAFGVAASPLHLLAGSARVGVAWEPLPPPLPAQTLVDLLKHPLCVGEVRDIVLAQLSRHYHRPFADQWEFVRFARAQKLDLDLTTPPRRAADGK